jgi:hypothetical protein
MSRLNPIQLTLAGTLLAFSAPMLGHAASNGESSVTFPTKRSVSYAAPLADITAGDRAIKARVIDWRQPVLEMSFDLSEADLIDKLDLLLTADPLGKVSPNTPLLVQFNNDIPQRISTRGRGFDARITLNSSKARARRNTIRVTYDTPRGAECVLPQHGGWLVDLKNSKLVVNGRAKSRALQLREVEMRLDLPAIAPRRVGVIASGNDAPTLQALAAQGVGLRMETLPRFTTTKGAGDFEIIMGLRNELTRYTSDKMILNGAGPQVYVPRGRPMRLFITADTNAQLLETARSFATYKLPQARRQITSLGELQMQTKFSHDVVRISGTQKLEDIPGSHFISGWNSEDWASGPQALHFSVDDPAATSGEVILKLAASDQVSGDSKLRVALNGEYLGSAKLDKTRKTVAFAIQDGALRGTDNVLTLTPELKSKSLTTCFAGEKDRPNFFLGRGSKIVLNNNAPSPVTELSRMAATGVPFSNEAGVQSYIALPKGNFDFNASLKVLAQLAKVSGQGLTDAIYDRSGRLPEAGDRHVLVIKPASELSKELRAMAPSAFDKALKGQAISGDNLLSAALGEYASNSDLALYQQFAAVYAKTGRINAGGVSALFGSDDHMGRVIGVMTNTPGQSFTTAMNQIVRPDHWSELEGGVARWNSRSVLLAQTAQPVMGYQMPALPRDVKFPDLSGAFASFELPKFDMPNAAALKAFGVNAGIKIKSTATGLMAKVKPAPSAALLDFKSAELRAAPQPKAPSFIDSVISAPKTAPKLKPIQAVDIPALRGPISATHPAMSFSDKAQAAWGNTKIWAGHAKANTQRWFANFNLGRKIDRLQDQAKPLGAKLKSSVKADNVPGAGAVRWADRHMSAPAMIMIMVLALIFLLMGLSSPKSRLGGRH